MILKGKSLAIMTPMYGGVCTANYFSSCLQLQGGLIHFGIPYSFITRYNESLVTRARNRCVDDYMKNHEHTHALFIDADIGFDPRDILAMLEHDFDIVAAPCTKKIIRWDKVQDAIKRNGRQFSGRDLERISGECVYNLPPFMGDITIDLAKPLEVETVGAACMMIRRPVFEKYREEYPDRWYSGNGDADALPGTIHEYFRAGINPETRDYDSEDYCFCKDVRKIGFKIWMLPWMKTSHFGSYAFSADLQAEAQLVGRLKGGQQ